MVAVLPLADDLVASLELLGFLDGQTVLAEVEVGEAAVDALVVEEYLGGEIAAYDIKLRVEAALDDILVVVALCEAGAVALHVLENEHVLLGSVAEGGVPEELELAAVDDFLGCGCGLGAVGAAQLLVVLVVDLPCAFEVSHAAEHGPGALAAYAAVGEVGGGLEQFGCILEVPDDEVGDLGTVVALGE